jgi:hypothetical protein
MSNDNLAFVVASSQKDFRSPIVWGVRSTHDLAEELRTEVMEQDPSIDLAEIVIAMCLMK